MTDQLMATLRAADPARSMPPVSEAARETTRQRILGVVPVARAEHTWGRPRVGVRRRAILAAVAVLVASVPLGGWAYRSYFSDRGVVVQDYRVAQESMRMPPGVTWRTADLPADAIYGAQSGFIAAWHECTNAWLREWLTARESGDVARQRAAIVAVERQISLMPRHESGNPEEAGGFDATAVKQMTDLVDRMKVADAAAVRYFLRVNP